MSADYSNTDPNLGQKILQALRRRAPVKALGASEFRTRCLRPENHKHADAHPSFDFNPDKGGICRVCGYKAGLVTLAKELGIIKPGKDKAFRRFETEREAMEFLMESRRLRSETIAYFGITADIKKQAWAYPLPSGHWRWKNFASNSIRKYWHQRGTPNQLYGSNEVPAGSEEILIVNGEPAVWVCYQARVPAVCGVYGEGTLPEGTLNTLLAKGVRKITIVPDLDEHGRRAAMSDFNQFMDDPVLKHLDPSDELEFAVLQLPQELGHGADLVDLYVRHGGDDNSFRRELSALPRLSIMEFQQAVQAEANAVGPLTGLTLFHDEHNEPYAAFDNGGRQHVLKISSTPFRRWLAHRIYTTEGKMPSDDKMRKYLRVLEGRACFEGELIPLHVRVAWHNGAIYYDLGDWRAVRVSAAGWEIVDRPPILFRHFPHQQSQVEPQPGGKLDELDCFINLASPDDRLLVCVYLITALVAGIPRPIIIVFGDQGSGKSFFFRTLKTLLDPSSLTSLSPPDNPREFVQLASHHHVVYLDNLSTLPVWLSDAFSRLCTGEGLSKRMLYTDDDDVIYAIRHLGGLNGINLVASKADLLDRSLIFCLEAIPDDKRRPEAELWEEFEKARPRILGAMFDGLAAAMRELPTLRLKALPRMADFTRWGCAVSKGLGYGEWAFLQAYQANMAKQNQAALESSPVAVALCSFMEARDEWAGTPAELMKELQNEAEKVGVDTRGRLWPRDVRWLTRRLREVRPNLQRGGIRIDIERRANERLIVINKIQTGKIQENDVTVVTDVIAASADKLTTNDIICDIKKDDVMDDVTARQLQNDINDDNDIIFPYSTKDEVIL